MLPGLISWGLCLACQHRGQLIGVDLFRDHISPSGLSCTELIPSVVVSQNLKRRAYPLPLIQIFFRGSIFRVGNVAQLVKVFAKADGLGLIPESTWWESRSYKLSSALLMPALWVHPHTETE